MIGETATAPSRRRAAIHSITELVDMKTLRRAARQSTFKGACDALE
jgi:hypothetical protein